MLGDTLNFEDSLRRINAYIKQNLDIANKRLKLEAVTYNLRIFAIHNSYSSHDNIILRVFIVQLVVLLKI